MQWISLVSFSIANTRLSFVVVVLVVSSVVIIVGDSIDVVMLDDFSAFLFQKILINFPVNVECKSVFVLLRQSCYCWWLFTVFHWKALKIFPIAGWWSKSKIFENWNIGVCVCGTTPQVAKRLFVQLRFDVSFFICSCSWQNAIRDNFAIPTTSDFLSNSIPIVSISFDQSKLKLEGDEEEEGNGKRQFKLIP